MWKIRFREEKQQKKTWQIKNGKAWSWTQVYLSPRLSDVPGVRNQLC
jgi:hypothetical protein